ncbi:MAG: TIGR03435 family protein [Bryobacteraceae bacterium]
MPLLIVTCMFGQISPPPLTYEVASIKPSANYDGRTLIQIQPGGGLRTTGATLRFLVTLAYDVRPFQVSGGPGWIDSDRFDIVGKPERGAASVNATDDLRDQTDSQSKTAQEQMRSRLRALLADRFQLVIHRETKEGAVYALVVGKNGAKLKPADGKEESGFRGLRIGTGQLTGSVATLEMLVTALSNQLGRPGLDRTGLKGNFDFKLEWTPDATQSAVADGGAAPDPGGPSLFTAIQEQLGLRLESQKGPVETIVIDRVERPLEN